VQGESEEGAPRIPSPLAEGALPLCPFNPAEVELRDPVEIRGQGAVCRGYLFIRGEDLFKPRTPVRVTPVEV